MKLKFLLFTLLCCGFAYGTANATETEPNDTRAQASTLALNGSNSGAIGSSTDVDWYKVTTNGDGRIDLTLSVSNGLYANFALYDNDGVTQINNPNTSETLTYSADGLAAGTYYVRISAYYAGQLPAYTISDALVKPAQANDTEPNDTKSAAITLPLNNLVTGHAGYYYKNLRDSSDWYKLTTNADGAVRLTITSHNGTYVSCRLFDHDGTTQLAYAESVNNSGSSVTADGLAAGTYYVKVNSYYNNQFEPYTLADSLFKPAQSNDAEPNDTKSAAVTLPLNKMVTGHTGYYYNNLRDSSDWYKLTTNADGAIRLTITSHNGNYVSCRLFDHDGSTQLAYAEAANSTSSVTADGLAAGTYYVKVNSYYNNQFEPYTLADSLFTYSYAADAEPNTQPYQAKTLPANAAATGHVGFYYNNARDSVDWRKINYTGTGALTLSVNENSWLTNGSVPYYWVQVYQDTSVSPIYSQNFSGASGNINFSALTEGYYYIKIFPYYNNQFVSYSITPTFTQVDVARISIDSYDTVGSCSTNSITYSLKQSSAPYTVRLYQNGSLYDTKITNSKKPQFTNLPNGSYYAKVYGDGATGSANSTSKTVVIEPVVSGLNTTNIKATKATLNWGSKGCADAYSVKYREHGKTTWKIKTTNETSLKISNLAASTKYEWEVAVIDSADNIYTGNYSEIALFTTAASLVADVNSGADNMRAGNLTQANVVVSPNPAVSYFIIHINSDVQKKLHAFVYDANGKAIWSSGLTDVNALNGKQVNTNQFAKGIFYLKVMNEQGELIGSTKIVIAN